MGKKLSEMTLEELWQLFPIILTEHQPHWADWYALEAAALQALLPGCRISHIGSTAIPGIWAKPIVDILMEAPIHQPLNTMLPLLVKAGWICMNCSAREIAFNKGYTDHGFAEKVFHLHLRHAGDHDELYFRDYLTEHPEAAHAYQQLKLGLWPRFEHDRDGYTAAKADFVRQYTLLGKQEYPQRYE